MIVGAGTMGHGMAQVFATEGYEVSLFSRTKETLDRAVALQARVFMTTRVEVRQNSVKNAIQN